MPDFGAGRQLWMPDAKNDESCQKWGIALIAHCVAKRNDAAGWERRRTHGAADE